MRAHHKKELLKALSRFADEDMFQLSWAANILQSENSADALAYLDWSTIPRGAVGAKLPNEHSIHKWEIETLANEILTAPKQKSRKWMGTRFRPDHYGNFVLCVNRLRKLENKEFRIGRHSEDVFGELARIASRQFPWQIGSANMANFYRSSFIYGQGRCAEAFSEKYSLSLDQFTKVSFALFAYFMSNPVLTNLKGFERIDVSPDMVRSVLKIISLQHRQAKIKATEDRSKTLHIAYKPSLFRQYPCVNFSNDGLRLRSPLPQLIMDRMTSGIFYDLVSEGGDVSREYGQRFEEYCLNYSRECLNSFTWNSENNYRVSKQTYATPDLLCYEHDTLLFVGECKATRMTQKAMYGMDPSKERGFEDLVKAVKQIWRFFAHSRLGFSGVTVSPATIGAVITLDNWLVMAERLRSKVLERAHAEIDTFSNGCVIDEDKRWVSFIPVQQLERVLASATPLSFKELLGKLPDQRFFGWNVDMIHEKLDSYVRSARHEYPFSDRLDRLVPWWRSWD